MPFSASLSLYNGEYEIFVEGADESLAGTKTVVNIIVAFDDYPDPDPPCMVQITV